jgi:hypothetical protein
VMLRCRSKPDESIVHTLLNCPESRFQHRASNISGELQQQDEAMSQNRRA